MFTRILIGLIVVLLGLWLYVRLAPNDPADWHTLPDVETPQTREEPGGYLAARRITAPADEVLNAVMNVARSTDRTVLVSGDVAEGMLTFRTRSRVWGFPDHTTVAVQGDLLVIYGRLRFGGSDLGVNKDRVERWLAVLGPLTEPL